MGNRWRKIKLFFGMKVCAVAPPENADFAGSLHDQSMSGPLQMTNRSQGVSTQSEPTTPSYHSGPIQGQMNMGRHSLKVSRNTCAICLESMKPGSGHALFTAECSHTFHFSCISSSVKFGNLVCPVCRAKWKEMPWQAPSSEGTKTDRTRTGSHHRRGFSAMTRSLTNIRRSDSLENLNVPRTPDPLIHLLDLGGHQEQWRQSQIPEPMVYNDDEPLVQATRGNIASSSSPSSSSAASTPDSSSGCSHNMKLKVIPEVNELRALDSRDNFTILLHLKAPSAWTRSGECVGGRAPIDLVTVLDVSGSMAGSKLELLKQAMAFVTSNLSAADRLSIVAFSSSARRICPLKRMVEEGKQQVLRAVDALISTGGTNIAEGLRKGAKVLEDRRERNPVAAIILLSDGQDTYTLSSRRQLPFFSQRGPSDSRRLVPSSIRNCARHGQVQIPVHTFGFGADHDAAIMHNISEVSGGTFSFIQHEDVMQDAFAQCIGGLLSVVAQDVQLTVSCCEPGIVINEIRAGSYESSVLDDGRHGVIKLGDLYAEEERDILVEVKIPACIKARNGQPMAVVQAGCMFKDPVTQETNQNVADDLYLRRPEVLAEEHQVLSLEVDRQRNRFSVAEAIAKARFLADSGNIESAQRHLQRARMTLETSVSAISGDLLCTSLEAELSEIQGRMANQQLYETSGRAYLLSAQSSHLQQRATTRGETLVSQSRDYQTSSMVDLVHQSQSLTSAFPTPGAFPSGSMRPSQVAGPSLLTKRASKKSQNSRN